MDIAPGEDIMASNPGFNERRAVFDLGKTCSFLKLKVSIELGKTPFFARPNYNKVFPSDLYNEVSTNLTNSSTGVAILRDVPVLANDFFGVEAYTLDELIIIISNPVSQEVFMNQFEDKERISAALDSRFPTYFQVSLPDLDANVLCLYEQWKVRENLAVLEDILR